MHSHGQFAIEWEKLDIKRIVLSSIGFHYSEIRNNWNRCKPTNGFEFVNSVALQIIIFTRNSSSLESLSSVSATIWDISVFHPLVMCRRLKPITCSDDALKNRIFYLPRVPPTSLRKLPIFISRGREKEKIFRKLDLTTFFKVRARDYCWVRVSHQFSP